MYLQFVKLEFALASYRKQKWATRDALRDIFLISTLVGSCEVLVRTCLKVKTFYAIYWVRSFQMIGGCSSSVYPMTWQVYFKPLYCFVFIVNKMSYVRKCHGLNIHENVMRWNTLLWGSWRGVPNPSSQPKFLPNPSSQLKFGPNPSYRI